MKQTNNPILTPNQITMIGLILTLALFCGWFLIDGLIVPWLVCAGFILVHLGDFLDGIVARRYQMQSMLGIYFDPAVDHISYAALTILMIDAGLLPVWFLFIFILANTAAGFVKNFAAGNNRVVSASLLAKVKTDLVFVPLACLFFIHNAPQEWQLFIVLGIGLFWLTIKYVFGASEKHTLAMRIATAIFTLAFLLRPNGIDIPEYYTILYLALAIVSIVGSAAFYFWDNRDLFRSSSIAKDPNLSTNQELGAVGK
ncbi:MAG: CDP-alcohol phosphatidyltransferase family protein [Magnetococcales bacterium]|nr:CDP-alcohol phosphatidyltransferase family protein [Magnetococcales bacterium]